jgi:hypothetical protein
MRLRRSHFLAFAICGLAACSAEQPAAPDNGTSATPSLQGVTAGEPRIYWDRDESLRRIALAPKPAGTSTLLTLHGGNVLASSKSATIFWGSNWNSASFAGDIITGLDQFYQGWGGSNYNAINTEYYGNNGPITNSSSYLGHTIDASTPPSKALSVSQAVAEACRVTGNNPDPDALYAIYTQNYPRGSLNYCAWHSYGTCTGGKPVQVAYFPNVSGKAGCDPQDTYGTGHSQGLAALANVSGHELAETITDPRNGGWYDGSGAENADKCAWVFNGAVTLTNGSRWKIQMNWSNAAYSNNTGLPNRSGENGCLQGN